MASFLAILLLLLLPLPLLPMVAPEATASFPTCPAGESAAAAAETTGFSSPTCPSAGHSLMKAARVLSKTGSRSMALALTRTPGFDSPFLTVFSPIDPPFHRHSFPPLSSFQLHFSPSHFSSSQLQSLPLGHRIPTLHPNRSLVVTAAAADRRKIRLNDVDVRVTPIYDDGYAAIYRAYNVLHGTWGYVGYDSDHFDSCLATAISRRRGGDQEEDCFLEAAAVLRRGGFSTAAAFLEAQLLPLVPGQKAGVTLFAPPDAAVETNRPPAWPVPRGPVLAQVDLRHHAEFVAVLVAHAIPCRLAWSDLVGMEEGSLLQTYSELGFQLHVTRDTGVLAVNGAAVDFPDLYKSSSLVVHGLSPAASIAVKSVVVNCSAKMGGAKNITDQGCRMLTRITLGPLVRPPRPSLLAAQAGRPPRPPVVNCSTAVLNPGENPFARASVVLKQGSEGVDFSASAALLDAQLVHHFLGKTLTFFAPSDAAIMSELPPASSGFGELHSLLSKYIAPCTPASSPTGEIRAILPTFADGHFVRIELDYTGTVNGIWVAMPNLYEDHNITVHGLRRALPQPEHLPFLPESCPKGMPDYVINYLIAVSLSILLASCCHKKCVRFAARRREQAIVDF